MTALLGCWADWAAEDWRYLARDGLVRILAEVRWQDRVDHLGRNVAMAGLLHDCEHAMFDQLMLHAVVDCGLQTLMSHEDARGVRFPAYALRHGSRMKTASSSIWKDQVFSRQDEFVNKTGLGVFWQMQRLAGQTIHPHAWFPVADPLPVLDQKMPAPGISSIRDWLCGMPDKQLDEYAANRLLVHLPGRPRSHAPDIDALETWVLPIYRANRKDQQLDEWSSSGLRMMRVVDKLSQMVSISTLDTTPPTPGQSLLLGLFDEIRQDMMDLWPLHTHPDRHVVKWMMEEQRLGVHWESLLLAVKTPLCDTASARTRL